MKQFFSHTGTETELDLELLVQEVDHKDLILYNDDVNTFEFVIDSLIKVCGHEPIQAEQCSFIVHFSGKCAVKKGEFSELEPMCTALLDRGLSACIE
ncbi:MAG: ATP-dependent Clp protease adaptor protein ClpS [Bacteroidetes bacterium]|nr:MAG: ATP-dependent Clp protease adaptor protein ClpS [Bacteroidota bacterium]